MEQLDFGEENRYVRLDDNKDPLVKLNAVIPWELFRPRLRSVWREPDRKRKSNAGRKPWDEIVIFKTIILCALYNLSDEQVEYQILDRLSFTRFSGGFYRNCGVKSFLPLPKKTLALYAYPLLRKRL